MRDPLRQLLLALDAELVETGRSPARQVHGCEANATIRHSLPGQEDRTGLQAVRIGGVHL